MNESGPNISAEKLSTVDVSNLIVNISAIVDLLNGKRKQLNSGDIHLLKQIDKYNGFLEQSDGISYPICITQFADDIDIHGYSKINGYTARAATSMYVHLIRVVELLKEHRLLEIHAREIEIEELKRSIESESSIADNLLFYSTDGEKIRELLLGNEKEWDYLIRPQESKQYEIGTTLVQYSSSSSRPFDMYGKPYEWREEVIAKHISTTSVKIIDFKRSIEPTYSKDYEYKYELEYLIERKNGNHDWIGSYLLSGEYRWMSEQEFRSMIEESRRLRKEEILAEKLKLDQQLEALNH